MSEDSRAIAALTTGVGALCFMEGVRLGVEQMTEHVIDSGGVLDADSITEALRRVTVGANNGMYEHIARATAERVMLDMLREVT